MILAFTVLGEPIPQGSLKPFTPKGWTRAILTSDNKRTKPWKQQVSGTALSFMEECGYHIIPKQQGVKVVAYFCFARPKSTKASVASKTTKPDIDKLVRAVLDALTGIVFVDDSQVVAIEARKEFFYPSQVSIRIETV